MSTDIVDELLGPSSPLRELLPRFEHRPSQLNLARGIVRAYDERRPLVCEAPTASGKSFAYLAAAVQIVTTSESLGDEPPRAVAAIANKSLQDQLAMKDIPAIKQAVDLIGLQAPRFTVVKGLSNYLCLKRADESYQELEYRQHSPLVTELVARMSRGWSGDFSSAPLPVPDRLRQGLVMSSTECTGKRCAFNKECAGLRARTRARTAEIVVTNFAMLMEHARLWGEEGRHALLGAFDALIVDEAHLLPSQARSTFGYDVSEAGTMRIVDRIEQLALGDALICRRLPGVRNALTEALSSVRRRLVGANAPQSGQEAIRPNERFDSSDFHRLTSELADAIDQNEAMRGLDEDKEAHAERIDELRKRGHALYTAAAHLKKVLDDPPDWFTRSIERSGRSYVRLTARPVKPGSYLRDTLWKMCPGATLLSATLRVGSSFRYICDEAGVEYARARCATVKSPLDLKRQMRFVCPKGAAAGNAPDWRDVTPRLVREVVERARGGVLVLATSRAAVRAYAEALQGVPYNVYVQGEGGTPGELANKFRHDTHSVLVGSRSFFEGLDVVGESLRVTIIDRPMFA
ncbi:MAG TPA: ATP-dependent DNA helicase, partial [Acidimicrobiia bacterium]|nr:ATP-dependent DNA helicase [Acidimicrobiia bacterium]